MSENLGLLKHIHVEGFKSIKNLDLDLQPLNIIIGPNGAGKSNFIGIFEFLYEIVNKRMQKYVAEKGGAEKFLFFGSKETNKIAINASFSCNTYKADLKPAEPDTLLFAWETACYEDKCTEKFFNLNGKESKLDTTDEFKVVYTLRYMKGFQVYHFHDTSKNSPLRKRASVNDTVGLRADGNNLASVLYKLKNTESLYHCYRDIVSAVQIVAPYFQDFILEPEESSILLRWQHKNSDSFFDVTDFSDGTLRFIALATLLNQPLKMMPDTILIDEPELGLHPLALKILAEMMQSVSKQEKQIIATTQSVTLINQFQPENIIVADRKDNQSVFRRLEKGEVENWLDEYAMGDIWEKDIIGGTPDVY